jgi:hypothetical protein
MRLVAARAWFSEARQNRAGLSERIGNVDPVRNVISVTDLAHISIRAS